jgi:type I restriction-modification system DNA methylase subunit
MEDILRNGSSKLTVNDAFQEITNLLLLKLIETDIINNKINDLTNADDIKIDESCILTNIYNKYCVDYKTKINNKTIKFGELFSLLYDDKKHVNRNFNEKLKLWVEDDDGDLSNLCIFKKIYHHKALSDVYTGSWKKYFKFEMLHENDIVLCINKLIEGFNIDMDKVHNDLLGDAFEKYRDGVFGAKNGLGQYFTSQYIIDKILTEVNLKPTDTLFDPACGAGGFFIKARKYIKEKFGDEKANNFSKENVFGYEVDPNIFKVLQVNSYIYGFKFNNFQLCDSITDKSNFQKEKFDVLTYNPPFGASFNCGDNKDFFPIKIKNSVGLFLQLGFKTLKENGRCGVVVDQGIINNGCEKSTSWESKIRKELLKNGLKKIILLPTGAFQYTNFAICILIYDKTYKKQQIIYEEGYFNKEDKGTRIKPMYFKNIGEITYEQVKNNNYSLKYDDYFKVEKEDNNNDNNNKYIKLGDIIKYIKYKSQMISHEKKNGKYPFYNSSIINHLYCDEYTNNEECLIINKVNGTGKCKIYYNNGPFSATSAVIIFKCIETINIKYLLYYLSLNISIVESKYTGSDKKSLNNANFEKILIPNLSLKHQNEIIEFLDEYFIDHDINEFIEYLGHFDIFQLLIDKKYNIFNDLQSYIKNIKNAEEIINNQIKWKLETKRKYLKIIKNGYNIINIYKNGESIEEINSIFYKMINIMIDFENIEYYKNLMIRSIFNKYKQNTEIKKTEEIEEIENNYYIDINEICDFNIGTKISKSKNSVEKDSKKAYPVYDGKCILFHTNKFNRENETIVIPLINIEPECVKVINGKIFLNDSCISISIKKIEEIENDICDINYIKYYLLYNQNIIYTTCQDKLNIDINKLKEFKIPDIKLEHQNEIVEFLDEIHKKIKIEDILKNNKDKPIFNLLINKNYNGFKNISFQTNKQNTEIKKLGDIVKFDIGGTPSRKESKYFNGDNLWVSISELNNNIIYDTKEKITDLGIKNSSVKLIEKDSILLSFKLSIGKLGIAGKNMYCNEAITFFKHENKITNKYLYYWFMYNDISKYASGQIGIGSLNKTSLYNIKIQIPSLEIQEEIINKIEKLNEHNSHYESYSNILKIEIDNIMEIIDNMTLLSNNKKSDKESVEESDKESVEETYEESVEESDKELNEKLDEELDKESVEETDEESVEETEEESYEESDEESDNEIQEIEYKNKLYHLIDNKIYNINDDGKTGKIFANYINGKIKKI